MRYGPNRISINSSVALHEIYNARGSLQKSKLYEVFRSFFKVASSGSIIDKVKHGARRRIIGQTLTLPSLKSMEGLILDNVRQFCDNLVEARQSNGIELSDSDWSHGRNMTDWNSRLTIDIIGGLLFGHAWDTLTPERKDIFLEAIPAGTKGFLMVCFSQATMFGHFLLTKL